MTPSPRVLSRVPLLILLPLGWACHDRHAGEPRDRVAPASRVSVQFAAQPTETYRAAHLRVDRLEAREGQAWLPLAQPSQPVAFEAQARPDPALAQGLPLGRQAQRRFRLHLAPEPGHTVTLADGSVQPLTLAPGFRDGVAVTLEDPPSRRRDTQACVLLLDLARAIQRTRDAGGRVRYRLWPVLRAVDRLQTGELSGQLRAPDGAPLAGALVTAQEARVGPSRAPVLARSAVTGADGGYRLDLLPLGRTYHVVAMPRVQGVLYGAQASEGFALTAQEPARRHVGTLAPAVPGQPLRCRLPNPAQGDRQDLVEVRKELGGAPFIVHTRAAVLEPDGHATVCELDSLPEGPCQAAHIPLTAGPEGEIQAAPAGPVKDCAVQADRPTQLEL